VRDALNSTLPGVLIFPGRCAAGYLFDLRHYLLRALERCRVWQPHVDQQVSLVLRGNEPGGHLREAEVGEVQQPTVDCQDDHANPQRKADAAGIDVRGRLEAKIE
jgi:hypothetical protein